MLRYVIWGAGTRGKRIFWHIGEERIEAFIDADESKIGKRYCGKGIISLKEYKEKFNSCYIIISCINEEEVIDLLKAHHIDQYFLMTDCPGEFQEPYCRNLLKNYVLRYIDKDKQYVVYGCTLYSMMVCEWMKQKGVLKVNIIPQKNMKKSFITKLSEQLPEYKFCSLNLLQGEDEKEILVTVEEDWDTLQEYKGSRMSLTNIYDCSDKIEEYYNPKIEFFKNLHTGKRCFIVATGPSLRMEDLDCLARNHEICISMNSIGKAFTNTEWRPDYYVAEEYRGVCEWGDLMERQNIPYLFFGDTSDEFWRRNHMDNCLKYHLVFETTKKRCPKFSNNFARKSYAGHTVTYAAIQLAVYMGFAEIYLLGVDFTYCGSSQKAYAHFYKEEKLISVGADKHVLLAYKAAKKYADENNILIYNATRGGKLEVFQRVNFDDLFT